MITIEKHDIKKLEEYIKHVERYRKEMKICEYEILENHKPENIGAGKSNLPGNPVERESVKKLSNKRYNTLRNIVNGVDKLVNEADEDTRDLINKRYWECPIGCYHWEDLAAYFGTNKTSILRRRDAMIETLANYIGYV
ncbi:transcriptional regulator [Staphylococcus capitis]|uniref:transcriptional regulator n=1 Tax=Staphylococcus capitis TaxID=29388 RepID=UPI001887580A|nr:transcriptional regulator [Staphylococcus capitis]MBF2260816.1 transcriptional regulator [Staphylococcus capitis]MBF2281260.1 transcriptional regulator [Staphylococcus capitis]